ncbi:MAG: nucleotidyltransferase substrate binding protein [Planctomycetaceae bacterium]|jgi:nucleotidyltransferase substrate binding protein (TIGR01987 family)|nr:nucleotidyltransferase substrate binding protein [Planctomycetaceae bacterium]
MTDQNITPSQNDDSRWRLRFSNFERAYFTFCRLIKRYEKDSGDEVVLIAIVHAFEFTYEIAWNLLRNYLKEEGHGEANGSKQTIRLAFKAGIIQEQDIEQWMDAIKNRNLTNSIYDQTILQDLIDFLVKNFFPIVSKLHADFDILMRNHEC